VSEPHIDDFSKYARPHVGSPEGRRLILRAAGRIVGTTVALLVLYTLVPVPGSSGAGVLVGLIGGLAVFAVVVGWQIQSIISSSNPVIRAVEVVSFALPLLVVVFAFTYLSVSRADPASFSEDLSRVDSFYFTVSTVSTVGFGDVHAESDAARVLVTIQMLFDLALIAGLVRLVILATRTGLRRRGAEVEPPHGDAD
jgi:hypothetical protein